MKFFSVFILSVTVFAGCASAPYQEMQQERDRLRQAYEDALRKNESEPLETALADKLIGTWQFLEMGAADGDISEEVAALAYQRQSRARKHLTLQFFLDRNVLHQYKGTNGSAEVTGRFTISSQRYGDVSVQFLRVFGETGAPFYEFLTGMSANRLRNQDSVSMKAVPENWLGVSVTAETLELIFHGKMELTPNGWARSGGIRCRFQRIE